MSIPKRRQTHLLRKGRISFPGVRYFITCACRRPCRALIHQPVGEAICAAWRQSESDGDLTILAATIMPDHVHLLFQLGHRLDIGPLIGKFKAKTKAALDATGATWQRNYFEHRLRPEDDGNPFARYIYLNPYREKLRERHAVWPWWRLGLGVDFDFLGLLEDGRYPPLEWITCDLDALGLVADSLGE